VLVALLGLITGLKRRSLALVLAVAIGSGAFLTLMSVWTRWMYGSWNPVGSYDTGAYTDYAAAHVLSVENVTGFLVAPDRGIFVWTPLLLVLLPSLVRSWRGQPDWSRSLGWGGLAYSMVQIALNRFSGGGAFYGYRLGLELIASVAPALALSAAHMGRVARTIFGPVLAIQVLAFAVGSIRDAMILPIDAVWHDNAFTETLNTPLSWVTLVLVAAIGWYAQRLWMADRREAPESAVQPRGKVNSHSVP
jgi:alpha-1,2-mannosyltransferase